MNPPDGEFASEDLVKLLEALYQLADRIATLSTAALALTITFRKDLVGDGLQHTLVLKASWICFVLSVIGFVLIYVGRISFHLRAVIGKQTPTGQLFTALLPWYFPVSRILLLAGFLAGLMLLALIGLID